MSALTSPPPVTERSAADLAEAIRRRELTSREVVDAHIERLERTAATINAVVADRFAQAREEASHIDQAIAQSFLRGVTEDLPPLLGVPFTLKESVALEGMPQSAGVLSRKDARARHTATAVKRLRDAGAIPIAVTNTSELTLWIESENRVYGRTNNPYDPTRTAGGSSGGEGAAIAVGGSPFGVAADVGGSIRIPALFCGVFGHKPSSGLVPNTGLWPATQGEAARMLATGPLSRRAEDLMPVLQIIAGPDGQDPAARSIELKDPASVSLDGLVVTTLEDTARRPLSRELLSARDRAVGALVSAGARARRISLPGLRDSVLPFLTMLTEGSGADGAGPARPGLTAALLAEAGEPPVGTRELFLGGGRHTLPTRITLGLERVSRFQRPAARERLLARAEAIADELREAIGDGVLLHPAFPSIAPLHRRTYGRPWLMMPSAVFNLAGVPVTEVPLGFSASGLPVGVQVAAGHGADHLSIAIAIELEAVFGGWQAPTGA